MTSDAATPGAPAPGTGLAGIDHVVVLMLENRSFDHMLGYLYAASGNPVSVYPITPSTPSAYCMPGADPGEGWKATNDQLWGADTPPAAGTAATMNGFFWPAPARATWTTTPRPTPARPSSAR